MPIFEYTCGRHRFEEIFLDGDTAPATLPCDACLKTNVTAVARRVLFSRVHAHGLGFHKQHVLEQSQGKKLRNQRDLDALDEKMWNDSGAVRTDPDSAAYKRGIDFEEDLLATEARIRREGGQEAVHAYQDKEAVQNETGWSDAEYIRYRDQQATFMNAYESGQIEPGELPALNMGVDDAKDSA